MEHFFSSIWGDLMAFDLREAFSATVLLLVAVDIIGAIPIVLSLKDRGKYIDTVKVPLWTLVMLIAFLYVGEPMLKFFGVDINSFALAGSIVLFVLAVEMLFGLQVFRDEEDGGKSGSSIVPLVFPLFAGAASFTALLTMRSSGTPYAELLFAIIINCLLIWLMLRFVDPLARLLGKGGIFILRKFFGVILLALSIKFFIDNLLIIIQQFRMP